MLAAPTSSVGTCVAGSRVTNSSARAGRPAASSDSPNRRLDCVTRMLIATPFMKPTRIGFDRKSATAPRRRKLAPMHSSPTHTHSTIEMER